MATVSGSPDKAGQPARRGSGDLLGSPDVVPENAPPSVELPTVDGWPSLLEAAAIGPFFHIIRLDDAPSWRTMNEFADHPDGLAARVTAALASPLLQPLRATPDAVRIRVAASVAFLGLAAQLISPAVGAALSTGIVPILSWEQLHWRPTPSGIVPLACGRVEGRAKIDPQSMTEPDTVAVLSQTLIAPTLALGATVARRFGLSGQIVRGNIASAIVGAVAAVASSGRCTERAAVDLAKVLIGEPGLTGSGSFAAPDGPQPRFRRNSCCLLYRAGSGLCGDCVLAFDRR